MRSSHFSLGFSAIGPSNLDETRDKADPPLQELRVGIDIVEFQQLQEVGVFSYLIYSLAKSHFNG